MQKISESQVHEGIVVSSTTISKLLCTGDSFGNLLIHKIANDKLLPYKKYKLHDAIRIIEKTKNGIVAISKNGDIRIVHIDEFNKNIISGPENYIAESGLSL